MANFKHAPHFVRATLVHLDPSEMAGNRVSVWEGQDQNGLPYFISAAELGNRGHAIETLEGGAGLYAVTLPDEIPTRFSVDYRNGVVELENGGTPVDLKEFLASSVRVTMDGRYICSFAEPLYRQQIACKEAGIAGLAHRQDLAELAELARVNGFSTNAGMYDIIASDIEDDVPYLQALNSMLAGRRLTESSPLFRRIASQGVPVEAWHEIAEMPQYTIPQVRAIFRMFMARYVEQHPIERILRIEAPTEVLQAALDETADLLSVDEPFDGANFIRGYRTSAVRRYRADGVDIILFSDPAGAYAYAYPSPPSPSATPAP